MDQIEAFVRKLCAEGDLSVLTKKLIRTQYQAHYNKTSVTREEKDKINAVLEAVVQELADQPKDIPVSAPTEEYVNSSSLEHGKENLHTDYVCFSNAVPPSSLVRQKITPKAPRTDLGLSSFGHSHLRRIQVSQNAIGQSHLPSKGPHSRLNVDSVGTDETVPQHQNSPLRRLSSDSVSKSIEVPTKEHVETECIVENKDDINSHKPSVVCNKNVAGLGTPSDVSGEENCVGGDYQKSDVVESRSADQGGDVSEDSIILISTGSDSSTQSNKHSSGKRYSRRKDLINNGEPVMTKSGNRLRSLKLPGNKQKRKNTRLYTVQAALSAILESDGSQQSELGLEDSPHPSEDEVESPLEQASPRTCHGSKDVKNGWDSSKEYKMNCDRPPYSVRDSVGSQWSHADMESEDSQEARLVIDESVKGDEEVEEPSLISTHHCKAAPSNSREGILNKSSTHTSSKKSLPLTAGDESGNELSEAARHAKGLTVKSCQSSLKEILQTGFSARMFFGKKALPVTPEKVKRKAKRLSIESDSDIYHDSMASPVCKSQSLPVQSPDVVCFVDPGSDSIHEVKGLYSDTVQDKDVMERSVSSEGNIIKTTTEQKNLQDTGKRKMACRRKLQDVPLKSNKRTNCENKAARTSNRTNNKKQETVVTDDSDLESLPLNCLRKQIGKSGEKVIVVSESDSPEAFGPHGKVGLKSHAQHSQKKQRKGGVGLAKDLFSAELGIKDPKHFNFSPPCSPVIKKTGKQYKAHVNDQKGTEKQTVRKIAVRNTFPVRLQSESTDGEDVLFSRRKKPRIRVVAKVSANVQQKKKSVYSLSESTEEEISPILSVIKKSKGTKSSHFSSRGCAPCGHSGQSLLDNTEDENSSMRGNVGSDSQEDMRAMPYRGEKLKFPVIRLWDIMKTRPPQLAVLESSCKRDRNIFTVLESKSEEEQSYESNIVTTKSLSQHTSHSVPSKRNLYHYVDSSDNSPVSGVVQPVSLDESRTVLKKQRTVERIAPKLRTTLKLRKQVSPDKRNTSPELEEWAVVSQEESDWSGDDRPLYADSPQGNTHCLKKSKSKKRKAVSVPSSSDDDDQPLKKRHVASVKKAATPSSSDEDDQPLMKRCVASVKKAETPSSSDEDDQPLKKRRKISDKTADNSLSETFDGDCEDLSPIKVKKSKKKRTMVPLDSSDEGDLPLKPRAAPVDITSFEGNDENVQVTAQSDSEKDASEESPIKESKTRANGAKQKLDMNSSEEDDLPLKPRSADVVVYEEEEEDENDDVTSVQSSGDDATPLKVMKSKKTSKVTLISSDDGTTPTKANGNLSKDLESDLDTSSLSSDDENETVPQPVKHTGPRIKFTMKKAEHFEKSQSQVQTKAKVSKKETSHENSNEAPYLKRLRLICRKVGIFVRNDVHFAGCTSDRQKIERLKEALKKAGMKGQPSLSKVDSVNLRREAEALDTGNIIETSGRPKRQPKTLFTITSSPKKSLSPIKQQFSRIRDLISESDSD